MSYTKQTWQTGDIITAEKLNHMEDGIGVTGGGGGDRFVLETAPTGEGLDLKTDVKWSELRAALESGKEVVCCVPSMGAAAGVKEYYPFSGMQSGADLTNVYFDKITVQTSDSNIAGMTCNTIKALCYPSDDTIAIEFTSSSRSFT